MTYVMSDLHGQYTLYREMLAQIRFSDEDELYILGDVVDRGPEPMKLLLDMSMRPNVFPILGNHDYMAEYLLHKLSAEITEENCDTHLTSSDIKAMSGWLIDGGQKTLEDFRNLTPEQRLDVLDYLAEFAPYEELTVGGNRFVLVHAGLPDFDPARPLSDYDERALLIERTDYSRRYYPDRFLVTGHTPTALIAPACSGRIYRANGHIAIDCGAVFGKALGCIRLDDFREFYVEANKEEDIASKEGL